jgi:pyruvate dehydrogenase E1 component alpha subunit
LGVESFRIDGNDVLEMYERTQASVRNCRGGNGPVLIEALTYRHGGHHVNDPGQYMPEDRLAFYKSKDPVVVGRKYLAEKGPATEDEIRQIETTVETEIAAAIEFAKESPEMTLEEFFALTEAY